MTTEDLKSMTVDEMFNWAGGFNYDLGLDVNGHTAVARELARRLEEAQDALANKDNAQKHLLLRAELAEKRIEEAQQQLVKLKQVNMSAGCGCKIEQGEEDEILVIACDLHRQWKNQRSSAHDAEVAADVIKAVQSTWPVTNAREFKAWLDAKAAEYRAKAGRKP